MEKTEVLFQEIESYVKGQPGHQGRTLCDRVIRACNHQLGVGSPCMEHIGQLVNLVELSLHGYDISAALVAQSTPLYMEKIVFHIVKKLSSLGTHTLCSRVAELLYNRLSAAQQVKEDFSALVRSCFTVLWNGVCAVKDGKNLNHQDKLHYQMQALSFLLLSDKNSTTHPLPAYADNAITEFESICGKMTKEEASFLFQEMKKCFNRYWTNQRNDDYWSKHNTQTHFYGLSEMVLIVIKVLCKANQYNLASTLLKEIETKSSNCTVLDLGKWGVNIHSATKAGQDNSQALTECARALRSLSPELDSGEAHAILRGCSLVVWAVESGHKSLSGTVLLAFFSFLEEQQERILKMLNQNSANQAEVSKLQKAFCLNISQGLIFANESLLASQLENPETLDRVLLYCQSTAGLMMTELPNLSRENPIIKTVMAVNNLACGLYNKHLYEQSFTLVEILCRGVCKNCPVSLSVEWLNRPFMLAVQASRRAGQLERALDWVIIWLKALGDNITSHMAEPVSLWVKTKIDAARNSEEDMRLRTLRDGFGPNVPDEQVMLSLLEEELRGYKESAGDTAQERYNTLCDLLEICHEESPRTHLRAVYLCEMAQVVCFQDFSEQTDCAAVDFIHEALRLLEEEQENSENVDKLKDDRAHALVWLYICTLEKNLQEAIKKDREKKQCDETALEKTPLVNDFDYENKQKIHDFMIYDGLHFSLTVENELCQPLEKALDEWSSLFVGQTVPSVRNPKRTSTSISVTAALFNLIGKPLKALEAYELVIGFSRQLGDATSCAKALCQSVSLLLDIGTPGLALAQLEEAEKVLSSDTAVEGPSPLTLLPILLKAQYYYSTGQVESGMPHLCEVLKEVNKQRQSKSWYLLRVQTLQTCSSYLSLDTATLSKNLRSVITQHGITDPDAALYESLKLLCSLLVTLVGPGLYGTCSSNSQVTFIDQGDNLVLKWQLLSTLLNCSMKMVAMRSSCGAVNDAKLQCLEALRLAIKLQSISQCAELLVIKAELELMHGETEECGNDLDRVRTILELCTDSSAHVQKSNVKIKPRKGRPLQKPQSTLPVLDDELKDLLSIRWIAKEPLVNDQPGSPPLKAHPRRWLSSLAHTRGCLCPCCSEPCLGRATVRWAAAQADLVHHLDSNEADVSSQLHCVALSRSKTIATKLAAKLSKIFSLNDPSTVVTKPSLMQDIVGQVYLNMAQFGLQPKREEVSGIWGKFDAGLSFVDSCQSPVLRPVRAGLLSIKAIASVLALAAEKVCTPEELFSNVWTWNSPKQMKLEKSAPIQKKHIDAIRNLDVLDNSKEVKKTKPIKPKIQLPASKSSKKCLVPKTPALPKSGSSVKDHSCFDFSNAVPTLACTPLQKVKAPGSVQRAPRTASKLQFQVYEELSPTQDKAQPVPAAPKRVKKLRFKVEFSDESDSETKDQTEPKEKAVPKKRTTQRAVKNTKTTSNPPAEKATPKRQVKGKKSTALSLSNSSEDDATLICQPVSTRRGRSRNLLQKAEIFDEPDKMRTIDEESREVLDISLEELRTSDNEAGEDFSLSKDTYLEVLRRDICWERDELSELKGSCSVGEDPHTHFTHSDNKPAHLLLEDVQALLHSAWVTVHHLPPPTTYPTLCALLALTTGQQDPEMTAMLHAESLGVTNRHRAIRHLASCRRKMKKATTDLAEKMDSLSLDEHKSAQPCFSELRLSQMENFYSFSTAGFPESQEFKQQIQHLPQGVTVCMMSVLGVKPGVMGDTILLSHLEKDSTPVTVHIPTAKDQHSISWLVQELDSIKAEQKVVNCSAEKAKWWEGRRGLDSRVEHMLRTMESLLGCWKSLLLPVSLDPELSTQAHILSNALSSRGVNVSEEILKVVLSASHVLTKVDLKRFAFGVYPQWDAECDQLLQAAVSRLSFSDEPRGHVVLILDKYLQRLPWESMSILKSRSVTRMPSLHSLLGLSFQKNESESILSKGVNRKEVYYVLDPDANLEKTQDRFKEWFCSESDWQGVCGVPPDGIKLQDAVVSKDLYIYLGHGAGSRFLDSTMILKRPVRAASLLFGCSSAALAVHGSQEGQGIILSYILAGCPFVLGNLWDVTDADLDRFTMALLRSWLAAPSGASLLDYMDQARQATYFKHLIGAAPVVYGLPIHLM